MSLTEMFIRVLGAGLALVGFMVLLSLLGISIFGIEVRAIWGYPFFPLLLGLFFLGGGVYIVRGGNMIP